MKNILSLCFAFYCCISIAQISDFKTITIQDVGLDNDTTREFGYSLNSAGDFNGDGNEDIVFNTGFNVGTDQEFDGGFWIGLLDGTGNLDSTIYIYEELRTYFGLGTSLFGMSVDAIGDLDKNGTPDFVLGVPGYKSTDQESGIILSLFMENDGSIKSIIPLEQGNFGLDSIVRFGNKLEVIGDINKDGVNDLGVSLRFHVNGSSTRRGAILVAFMTEFGFPLGWKIIPNEYIKVSGSFWGFGIGLAGGSDFNGDGNIDIIVGASHGEIEGDGEGAAVILYLDESANVINHLALHPGNLISSVNFFTGDAHLGETVSSIGDITGDEIPELILSVNWSDYGVPHIGHLLIVSLNKNGEIDKIAPLFDPLKEDLDLIPHDHFGNFIDVLQDYNGDGFPDIICSVQQSWDAGWGNGEIRLLQSNFDYLLNNDYSTAVKDYENYKLNIWPNPSSDYINITADIKGEIHLEVFNSAGKLIHNMKSADSETTINIKQFKKGFYWLRIQSRDGFTWAPFVKN